MINNLDQQKSKVKPYHHQISLDCKQILTDGLNDPEYFEFIIKNFNEMIAIDPS